MVAFGKCSADLGLPARAAAALRPVRAAVAYCRPGHYIYRVPLPVDPAKSWVPTALDAGCNAAWCPPPPGHAQPWGLTRDLESGQLTPTRPPMSRSAKAIRVEATIQRAMGTMEATRGLTDDARHRFETASTLAREYGAEGLQRDIAADLAGLDREPGAGSERKPNIPFATRPGTRP